MFIRKEKGFTLVELLIVIVIIGVLAAAAIPKFLTATANSKKQACRNNLSTIESAIAAWFGDHAESDKPSDVEALAKNNYLKRFISCPSGGNYIITDGDVSCPNATSLGHTLDQTKK